MFENLVQTVLGFIMQYGYLALFVYMVLETAFILHFVPSEIVIPVAASQLVHSPASFVLFVTDTTAGATIGSFVAYELFGRYGKRLIERYGYIIHVSEENLERSQGIFIEYGASSVFWARMVPFFRALISIPAGLAEMDLRRFIFYSAVGTALFNTGLTYLVYTGSGTTSPLDVVIEEIRGVVGAELTYAQAHVELVAILVGLGLLVAGTLWLARDWIRTRPELAKLVGLHVIRLVGLITGGAFIIGALSSPEHALRVISGVWNDPLFWVHLGFSEQVALLLTGGLIAISGVIVYELGKLVELAQVQATFEETFGRFR